MFNAGLGCHRSARMGIDPEAKEVLLVTGDPTYRVVTGHTVGIMRFDPYTADPDAYSHAFRLARHLAGCPLDPVIRNLVELRASQINGCAFCLDLHSGTARHAELAERKLDLHAVWREAPDFSSRERAALALAEEMVRIGDGRRVGDETWARVRTEFDDDEIAGLLYTIALIGFWNSLNVAVEFPAAAKLPTVR